MTTKDVLKLLLISIGYDRKVEIESHRTDDGSHYYDVHGEEMGLGKPWEPDYDYNSPPKYIISCYFGDIIKEKYCGQYNRPLSFPTAEIRDAFKENFDPDIEICKVLL